ncbi:MAG: TIGR00266 family protein [bacterium]
MEHELIGSPDYGLVRLTINPGEEVKAEAGAMVGMSEAVNMETGLDGGVFASAKRSVLGGESMFINTFTAEEQPGRLELAPGQPGDVIHLELEQSCGITRGGFMALGPGVEIDPEFGGFKGFFSGLGFGMLRATGSGSLFLASFGGIRPVEVSGEYVVDTGHILAFEESLQFNVETVGGWKPTLLSGEGLVCRFKGNGKVYVQTRNAPSFASWAHPFREVESSDED